GRRGPRRLRGEAPARAGAHAGQDGCLRRRVWSGVRIRRLRVGRRDRRGENGISRRAVALHVEMESRPAEAWRDRHDNRLNLRGTQKKQHINRRAKRPAAVERSGETGLPLTPGAGSLFNRRAERSNAESLSGKVDVPLRPGAAAAGGKHWLAVAGVYLFTLMLYARPNDLIPAIGSFPLVKIVAVGVMAIYVLSKVAAGERLSVWTLEMTMLIVISALGLLLMPTAASPKDSIDMLTDSYLKT